MLWWVSNQTNRCAVRVEGCGSADKWSGAVARRGRQACDWASAGMSEVFERTFVPNSRFRGWIRVREFYKRRGDGQDDDSYTTAAGRPRTGRAKMIPADLSNAAASVRMGHCTHAAGCKLLHQTPLPTTANMLPDRQPRKRAVAGRHQAHDDVTESGEPRNEGRSNKAGIRIAHQCHWVGDFQRGNGML